MARSSHVIVAEDDATMTTEWDRSMQEQCDQLQRALTDVMVSQTTALSRQAEATEARLIAKAEETEQGLTHRLAIGMENLRGLIRSTAEVYGGSLDAIHRRLDDLVMRVDARFDGHDTVLANHRGRIEALEHSGAQDATR